MDKTSNHFSTYLSITQNNNSGIMIYLNKQGTVSWHLHKALSSSFNGEAKWLKSEPRLALGGKRAISWSCVCAKRDQWHSLFPIFFFLPNAWHQWYAPLFLLMLNIFMSYHSIIIIIIIIKGRQCKAEREWCTPYQSEDPSPTIPTNRQKEEKGKKSRRL